jgi:hypothetical protein
MRYYKDAGWLAGLELHGVPHDHDYFKALTNVSPAYVDQNNEVQFPDFASTEKRIWDAVHREWIHQYFNHETGDRWPGRQDFLDGIDRHHYKDFVAKYSTMMCRIQALIYAWKKIIDEEDPHYKSALEASDKMQQFIWRIEGKCVSLNFDILKCRRFLHAPIHS